MRNGRRGACKYMAFTRTIRPVRKQKVVVVVLRGIGALVVVLAMSWAFKGA